MRRSHENCKRRKSRSHENCKRRKSSAAAASKHDDRISELPNDILISIISRLALREATVTSILSKRWRYLWTYTTHLNFPPQSESIYVEDDTQTKRRIANYKNMIDHVLDSHKGGRLKEFRIRAPNLEGVIIGKWIEFALAKEVEIIHLNVRKYSLRHTSLINGERTECLKKLSLRCIDVDDRELELLLRNFPLLESLSIVHSDTLGNASIEGRAANSISKLKHLEISYAKNLELIRIDSLMNLISFRCHVLPKTCTLILNNVPKLIEFDTLYQCFSTVANMTPTIPSSIRNQLQKLKVLWVLWKFYSRLLQEYELLLVQFSGIKHLELRFVLSDNVTSLSDLFCLIQACSSLEKLEIEVLWSWSPELKVEVNEDKAIFLCTLPKLKLSPNLKRVKLSGFAGSMVELEFAYSIMKNVEALEELVVKTCEETKEIKALATNRAHHHFRPAILPYPFTLLVI